MVSWAVEEDGNNKHRTTLSVRLRYLFLFAVITGSIFLLLTIVNGNNVFINKNLPEQHNLQKTYYKIDSSDEDYTIRTAGCTIPALQPFDDTIKQFVNNKQPKPCYNSKPSIIARNRTHIWTEKENFHFHNIRLHADVNCCYKAFYRPSAVKNIRAEDVDDRVQYEPCVWFDEVKEVEDEFLRITCYIGDLAVHESYHIFALDKQSGGTPANKTTYNVLILGIDNVSRLNFHRTMPKTLSYLKRKGAVELLGYNKVGDNSFPNLIPMLLGVKSDDLKNMCYLKRLKTFDNCPFVWESFKEAGYYTALGEDSAFLGTFNYGHHGFYSNPTDYYLRTFVHEAEKNVGNNRDANAFICMGEKYSYSVLLDYIEHLTSTLKSSKLFGFFWEVTMSHDYLNYPNFMDAKYRDFLNNLENSAYLNDTVLIILSDHGIRWGDIRKTKQGRLEERLPMVNILLPTSFKRTYHYAYQNLVLNRNRLTTPFDIYATLKDLANLDTITDEKIVERSDNDLTSRSVSLFLPIPFNRTCDMASIDPNWCTCHKEVHHSVYGEEARDIANHVIVFLNFLLEQHPECATLSVHEILDFIEMSVGEAETRAEVSWQEFMIVLRTVPGDGVFESTLRRKTNQGVPSGDWEISGNLNRLNMYTNQSQCVDNMNLKHYCYCNDTTLLS